MLKEKRNKKWKSLKKTLVNKRSNIIMKNKIHLKLKRKKNQRKLKKNQKKGNKSKKKNQRKLFNNQQKWQVSKNQFKPYQNLSKREKIRMSSNSITQKSRKSKNNLTRL